MNKTKTPTVDKVTFPLRLPPKMYKQIRGHSDEITRNCTSVVCLFSYYS